ncbi:hypothetical protein M0R45_027036 [Rubus argutus]|uniref:Uncharacterized protein n=1 Tax=Rubus argutus TaxID=59490 RepID=A0AAW1X0X6_RUBAR
MAKRPMGNPNIHWEIVCQILSMLPVKSLLPLQRRQLIFTDGENDLLYSLGLDEFLIRNVAFLDEDGVENKIDDCGVLNELDFKLPSSGDNGVFLVSCCKNLALCKLNSWEELYIVNPATKESRKLPAAPYLTVLWLSVMKTLESSIRGLPDVGGEVGIYIESLVSLK